MREIKKIEKFFLLAVLRIMIVGGVLILVTDFILTPEDIISLIIDVAILSTAILSFFIREKNFTLSALIVTTVPLAAMFYQSLVVPINTSTSFSVILIVGFLFSILLKGILQWIMHGMAVACIVSIFIIQTINPTLRFSPDAGDIISIAMTYLVLYAIISYCTAVLKTSYDHVQQYLRNANMELQDKKNEIEAQNEELLQIQDNLHELNTNLERMVHERTEKIKAQHEILIKYSYTNAHHLRGPVARLLGLVAIQRMESTADPSFFFTKIEEQANEIDNVVKKINSELQTRDDQSLN
ncbi:MAG: hypothetical protein JNM57_15890 [Cyclobacteriaceae bacterium]|nr:hypothetical protein [Cyclobacteriaceae bacterium]